MPRGEPVLVLVDHVRVASAADTPASGDPDASTWLSARCG
jgi:hypothetical protein